MAFSKEYKKKYLPEIHNLLEKDSKPTEKQIKQILNKKKFDLRDVYLLVQCHNDKKLRDLVINTSIKKREELWKNRLFLVPPLYITNECINDCLYCPWRKR